MKVFTLMIAVSLAFGSCENKNAAITEAKSNANAEKEIAPTAVAGNVAPLGETTPAANAQTVAETSGKPALNPPHGEPYHRCDIEVGAPLNSAPQAQAPQMITPQPQANQNFDTNPIAPTGPKPALNPPHGEPHHRCDLQVGAPLT